MEFSAAVEYALRREGAEILRHQTRFMGYMLDCADLDTDEMLVLERNCDGQMLGPYLRAVQAGDAASLAFAAKSVEEHLTRSRMISGDAAKALAEGLASGVARWQGVPYQPVQAAPTPEPVATPVPTRGNDIWASVDIYEREVAQGVTRRVTYAIPSTGARTTVDVKIPRQVKDGAVVRCAGAGDYGTGGGPRGDLLVTVLHKRDEPAQAPAANPSSAPAPTPKAKASSAPASATKAKPAPTQATKTSSAPAPSTKPQSTGKPQNAPKHVSNPTTQKQPAKQADGPKTGSRPFLMFMIILTAVSLWYWKFPRPIGPLRDATPLYLKIMNSSLEGSAVITAKGIYEDEVLGPKFALLVEYRPSDVAKDTSVEQRYMVESTFHHRIGSDEVVYQCNWDSDDSVIEFGFPDIEKWSEYGVFEGAIEVTRIDAAGHETVGSSHEWNVDINNWFASLYTRLADLVWSFG